MPWRDSLCSASDVPSTSATSLFAQTDLDRDGSRNETDCSVVQQRPLFPVMLTIMSKLP